MIDSEILVLNSKERNLYTWIEMAPLGKTEQPRKQSSVKPYVKHQILWLNQDTLK